MSKYYKMDKYDFTKSFFVLILCISAGVIGATMSCQSQRLMNNRYIKFALLLFVVYMGIEVTTKAPLHPLKRMGQAVGIVLLYLLFSKMTMLPTVTTFLTLFAFFFMLNLYEYNQMTGVDDSVLAQHDQLLTLLVGLVLVQIVCGFLHYVYKQKQDHGSKFSVAKFLLGSNKCAGGN